MTGPKKDNRGAMFPNANKEKATQPDCTGKVVIEGKEFQVAAWENTTADGKKYWSLTFSVPLPPNPNKAKPVQSGGSNNNSSNNSNSNNAPSNYNSSISEDLDDLDAILKSAEDDNPFN